jgi:hypothetical protein
MEKIDKLTKIEILVTDEGAQMFFNGYREAEERIISRKKEEGGSA